ncbi:MAG: DUF2378 family protein [Deltaproteobacteria bacterium]|nr:DUF2378 family protein [Deltaproteobacteria bacterium]
MPEQLVFAQTFESLFVRALGGKIDEGMRARLRELGVDVDRLEPAYPFATWMKAVALAASMVYPEKPPPEAQQLLGRAVIEGYRATLIGRTLLRFLKVMGPRTAVSTATNAFKTGNNYTETRLRELGPTSVELWMNEVGPFPEFTQGILAAGVEASGARGVKISYSKHDGHAALYSISWES